MHEENLLSFLKKVCSFIIFISLDFKSKQITNLSTNYYSPFGLFCILGFYNCELFYLENEATTSTPNNQKIQQEKQLSKVFISLYHVIIHA